MALLILLAAAHFFPNRALTPGAVRPLSTVTVCRMKWGKDERHVTAKMKRDVCAAYGITSGCPGPQYEIDHLVPRELAGADDVRNLWPEPKVDALIKDRVENMAHKQVCAGALSLADAQQMFRTDWTKGLR